MTEQDKEQIAELQEKIEKYETMLQETLSEQKTVGKIIAGPFVNDDNTFFRVNGENGGRIVFAWTESPFDTDMSKLEVGMEVIIAGQAIISMLPEDLIVHKEVPEFDLIEWNAIGGLKSQVDEIREAIEGPLTNAKLAEELGVQSIKGILLYGPPGTGKTLIAKAIASSILRSTKANPDSFVYIKGAELLSMYVGQTEQRIVNIFKNCREYTKKTGQKAVIFIDEAEAILPERGSMRSSDVDKTIVPTFLSEMDGFEDFNPIMILSTNLPKSIDQAVLREGRVDIKIEIKRPDQTDAEEIFKIHLDKMKCFDKVEDLVACGSKTLFSLEMKRKVCGAMIETVVKTAGRKALGRLSKDPKDKKKGIILGDLIDSINLINTSYVSKV